MADRTPRSEPLRIIDDHLLVQRDGRLSILDTGVPSSMPCPQLVSEILGVTVDRLIGCAELSESPLEIDWPGRRLVHDAPPRADAVHVPLARAAFGIPCIDMGTPQGTVRAILDTGAALSYAAPDAVEGLVPVRRTMDFLPGFGRFTVDVHRLDITVGGMPITVECGVLPPLLRMALALICPSGWILGTALFRDRVVALDLAGAMLHVSPATVAARPDPTTAHAATADAERDDHRDESMSPPDAPPPAAARDGGIEHSIRIDAVRRKDAAVCVRAAVTLRGTTTRVARPVQLALVLDRSGSMAGERLEAVREAARSAVRVLPVGSTVGIVTYSDSATTELPLSPSGAPETIAAADAAIGSLSAGGSTALADGWCAGRALLSMTGNSETGAIVDRPLRSGSLRRILLLSDGRANLGERSPAVLARRCADAALEGITTSTVGVGAGYDEDVLRSMAVAGSGSSWYVATPLQATAVLGEELGAMRSISALGTTLRVSPSPDVRIAEVNGGIHDPLSVASQAPGFAGIEASADGHVEVLVGELSAAAERTVVIEFIVRQDDQKRAANGDPLSLGVIRVDAIAPDGVTPIGRTIHLTWDGQVVADIIARREWLRLRLAAARLDAVRLADARLHARAVSRLR
ncbi:MAG: vWA domain-containing protein [Gemmatimonadaceae bacterium]